MCKHPADGQRIVMAEIAQLSSGQGATCTAPVIHSKTSFKIGADDGFKTVGGEIVWSM